MVNHNATCGLVVAHAARPTTLLDEFIELCEWPLLTQPSIRSVVEQIEISHPLCIVFWLDVMGELSAASKLVSQLRARGQRPFRIAVAHNLAAEVEQLMRSAGVHTYLTTNGNVLALVEGALRPFITTIPAPHLRSVPAQEVPVAIRGPTAARGSPANLRPP